MDALGLIGAMGALSGAGLKPMGSHSKTVNTIGGATLTPPASASVALMSWLIHVDQGLVVAATIVVKGGTALIFNAGANAYEEATWSGSKLELSNDSGAGYQVNVAFFG